MRRFIGFLLGLLGLPSLALAECGGTDQMALLAAQDPAAHAGILRRGAEVQNGEGIFWRVEGGTAPASYLFGTFHDTEIAEEPLNPAIARALEAARVMLVEISPADQVAMRNRMAADPGFVLNPEGPTLSAYLDPDRRAEAEAALAGRGLTLAIADRLRPAVLMSFLAMAPCVLEAVASGAPVLDMALARRAAQAGAPVMGVESYEEALASIDAVDRAIMGRLLAETLLNLDMVEDFRRTSVKLYREANMGAIQEFEIWQGARQYGIEETLRLREAFAASVIHGRNRSWLGILVPELEQGGVFAAFGALHLPGEQGLVALLRARGFTVTRLDG